MQKFVQFLGENFAGAGARTGIAVSDAGAVVGTHPGELCDLWLHFAPREIGIPEAGVENHGGGSLARAVDVHLVAADVDELAGHGMKAAIARLGNVLVEEACSR